MCNPCRLGEHRNCATVTDARQDYTPIRIICTCKVCCNLALRRKQGRSHVESPEHIDGGI